MRGSEEKAWAQQNGSPVQSPRCAQPFPTELSQPLITPQEVQVIQSAATELEASPNRPVYFPSQMRAHPSRPTPKQSTAGSPHLTPQALTQQIS